MLAGLTPGTLNIPNKQTKILQGVRYLEVEGAKACSESRGPSIPRETFVQVRLSYGLHSGEELQPIKISKPHIAYAQIPALVVSQHTCHSSPVESKKNGPTTNCRHTPQNATTLGDCTACSVDQCGFMLEHVLRFCLLTWPSRRKTEPAAARPHKTALAVHSPPASVRTRAAL